MKRHFICLRHVFFHVNNTTNDKVNFKVIFNTNTLIWAHVQSRAINFNSILRHLLVRGLNIYFQSFNESFLLIWFFSLVFRTVNQSDFHPNLIMTATKH